MVAKKRASARVNPPVLTRPERLPLGDENLSWEQFEAFCREFVSEINDGARCRHYGKKGNRQHGIDLVCEVKSGEKYVYQCRQWKSFSKSKAELTIAQTAYKADRYFVLLSSEASADVQDIFLDNPKWDIYDVRDISMRVRRLSPQTSRRLIEQHFGADWIKGFLGRPKATSLLTVKQKFGKQLIDKAKLFNHGWKLVGRDDELKTLSAFLDDTRHAVCVLPGAGTIGKTKLLYEFSKKNECAHPYISFLSETFSPDELTDCEFDPLLVIVDDAHMRPDLDAFLSLMRRRTAWTKVILAVRPGALGKIRSSLSRADFDTSEIVQLPRLKKLKFDQTCELAHQSLASNVKSFDEVLARQTSDSPLITLVAGRLLSERQVTPQQLESDPDFYQTVMTRFTELITGDGLADWQRRLLQFIACLSPVPVRDDWFMERCAKALGLSKSQVAQAVADFIEHGAVQQRGRLIEITPHVVSEHLLKAACLRNGVLTGFVEEVVELFGYREALLRNLAELDWKLSEASESNPKLLSGVWSHLSEDLRSANNFQRCLILSKLEEVALYQPEKVLALVKWIIANPRMEKDESVGGFMSYRHDEVLKKVPPLLRYVAADLTYLSSACDLLWELGRDEKFWQDLSHGCYVLRELSRYKSRTPVQRYLIMAQAVRRWFETDQAFGYKNSPVLILHNLLQKEEMHVYERGPELAWEPIKIDRHNTSEIRKEAIDLLRDFAVAADSDSAVEAVHELGAALSVPVRCFPGDDKTDKYVQWQPEHLQVLDALEQIMRVSSSKLVSLEAERQIRAHEKYIRSKETLKRCKQILDDAAIDLETRLTKAIISGLFEGVTTNWRREEKQTQRSYQDLACDVIRELTPQESVDKINAILNECQRKKRNTNPQHFLVILCQMDFEYAWSMCEILLAAPFSLLKWHIPALVSPLRKLAPDKAMAAINKLFAADLQSKQILSYAFACWDWLESRLDFEVEIFRALCREEDSDIKRWSAHSLIRMALKGHPEVEQIVLKDLLPGSDATVPAEIYAMFDGKHGFDPSGLSEEELLELLHHLENVPKIDEYGIVGFLTMALPRIPKAVVELFLLRIGAHAQERLTDQPIPYHLFDEASDHFNACTDIEELCRMVAAAAKTFDGGFDHYAILFREVSCNFGAGGRNVLLELSRQSVDDFALMCRLLKAAPRKLLFDDHAFINQLLQAGEKFGTEQVDLLCSSVVIVATAGVRERSHGEPSESDEDLRKKALNVAGGYPSGTVMNELYSVLSRQAAMNIESDLQWDEEHDYV